MHSCTCDSTPRCATQVKPWIEPPSLVAWRCDNKVFGWARPFCKVAPSFPWVSVNINVLGITRQKRRKVRHLDRNHECRPLWGNCGLPSQNYVTPCFHHIMSPTHHTCNVQLPYCVLNFSTGASIFTRHGALHGGTVRH